MGRSAPALVDRVQRAFRGVAFFNNYGCTEIGPRATAIDYSADPDKIGSIGRAIPGVNVTIVRPDLSVAGAGRNGGDRLERAEPDERLLSRRADNGLSDVTAWIPHRGLRLRRIRMVSSTTRGGGTTFSSRRARRSARREIEDVVMDARGGRRSGGHSVARSDPWRGSRRLRRPAPGYLVHRARAAGILRPPPLQAQSASRGSLRRRAPQDGNRQDSEIPAQGSAPVKSGETASVVGRATVPWGCWDPEDTLELHFPSRFSVQVNGMRDGRRIIGRSHSPRRCGDRSTRSHYASWRRAPGRRSSPWTTSRGPRRPRPCFR